MFRLITLLLITVLFSCATRTKHKLPTSSRSIKSEVNDEKEKMRQQLNELQTYAISLGLDSTHFSIEMDTSQEAQSLSEEAYGFIKLQIEEQAEHVKKNEDADSLYNKVEELMQKGDYEAVQNFWESGEGKKILADQEQQDKLGWIALYLRGDQKMLTEVGGNVEEVESWLTLYNNKNFTELKEKGFVIDELKQVIERVPYKMELEKAIFDQMSEEERREMKARNEASQKLSYLDLYMEGKMEFLEHLEVNIEDLKFIVEAYRKGEYQLLKDMYFDMDQLEYIMQKYADRK